MSQNYRAPTRGSQAVFHVTFGRSSGQAANGYRGIRGLDPIQRLLGTEVTPQVSETGCTMEPLEQ